MGQAGHGSRELEGASGDLPHETLSKLRTFKWMLTEGQRTKV